MPKFNPDFWETTLETEAWDRFATEDGLWHQAPEDMPHARQLTARAASLWPQVREAMADVLTERQRQVVGLHYLRGPNQRQIAQLLGITQQVVSEHLYGRMRKGRASGGALRKLRKACAKRGIRWDDAL